MKLEITMGQIIRLKRYSALFILIAMVGFGAVMPVNAEGVLGKHWQKHAWNDNHVIVFSDCGYSGQSKILPIGKFKRLENVGVEANEISSIIIPDGMAVEIFQNKQFGGHWYRMNKSRECLPGKWNDRIRSMRVINDNTENSYGFTDGYDGESSNEKCHSFEIVARRGVAAIRFVDQGTGLQRVESGRSAQGELCQSGLVRLELAKRNRNASVILKIDGREYRFDSGERYDDFRQEWYRKYLSIDLKGARAERGWANTAGFGRRYSSGVRSGENWGNNYHSGWNKREEVGVVTTSEPKEPEVGNNEKCVEYTVSGTHKHTGLRFFVGDQEFHNIGKGSSKKSLCHMGKVKVEMAKRRPDAEVVLRIGGKSYTFKKGDTGDRFAKTWYRKFFTVYSK
ncbi:MAG: hypothetical protein ACRBHB_08685 [Arenicella sp.]